jgi:hypothetical protein
MNNAAKRDVAAFASLDADVKAHNAGKLRVAIATGAEAPDMTSLPEHLADKRAKRALAAEKLAALDGVLAELAADLQASAKTVERRKYELDLAVEAVVIEDAEALATEWLADLEDLRKRFWMFEALSGRKVRLDPDAPLRHFSTGYRPIKLGAAVHTITIKSRGVIGGEDTIAEQQAKAVLVGEYIAALKRDAHATL